MYVYVCMYAEIDSTIATSSSCMIVLCYLSLGQNFAILEARTLICCILRYAMYACVCICAYLTYGHLAFIFCFLIVVHLMHCFVGIGDLS